jgi:DNA mismatch repair protein MSH5
MSDLQQISLCLRQVTGRSLVLIDEFGKGTNENGLSNLDDPLDKS